MAKSNVVAEVRKLLVKAIKSGDDTVQAPSKWASQAGFDGSAASPLRQHMARVSGNGCGRTARYPKMDAEELLAVLDLADTFVAEKAQGKRTTLAKKIGTHVRPARAGAKQAKGQAKASKSTRKAKATA